MTKKDQNVYTISSEPASAKHPLFGIVAEVFGTNIIEAAQRFHEQIPNAGKIVSIREGRMK